MADRIKDNEDRLLESMFASAPIADDGFSEMIEKRIRRQLWLRRMVLPAATLGGAIISFKPLAGFVTTIAELTKLVPPDILSSASGALPQLPMLILGAMLLGTILLGLRTLEE